MVPKQLILAICALFVFATFIMVIVATAGSSANYKPLNNIYIGKADISHINVTKVIPQVGPILSILGTALTAPNSSVEDVFGALKKVANTSALKPLLTLLSDANNTTATVVDLTKLAPMAVTTNVTSSTSQLTLIDELLQLSNNDTETIDSLESLVSDTSGSTSSDDTSATVVFELLADSKNVTASTEALLELNNMTLLEKMQLAPVFQLFNVSTNNTATFSSIAYLASANLSTPVVDSVLSALNTTDDVNATLSQLSKVVTGDMHQSMEALQVLLTYSSSKNVTLSTLKYLVDNNVTKSTAAREAFVSISELVENGNNTDIILSSVQTLAQNTNTTASTAQLQSLHGLFVASSNASQTLGVLATLEASMQLAPDTVQYVSPLFDLLDQSKNPGESFESLYNLSSWAQQNPDTFIPILNILGSASNSKGISSEALRDLTPSLMDYLNVNTVYQLSIFTLCESDTSGHINFCSESHAVQDLDFRSIIWDDLIKSDFLPYLNALNIEANDLHLDGKLLKREHEYVPAIRSTLALSILSIIFAFFTLLTILYLIVTKRVLSYKCWYGILFLVLWYVIFTCLSAIIVTAITGIIKSGTHDDDYGVVFKNGSAYMGLVWTSFVLSILVFVLMVLAFFSYRKESTVEINDDEQIAIKMTNEKTDDTSSNNDHINEKPVAS